MIDLDAALREIRVGVLAALECTAADYEFSHVQPIADQTGLPRDIVVATLRDLTNCGLARFARGLWTDDGTPAGAGYGLTAEGFAFLKDWQAITRKIHPPTPNRPTRKDTQ